VVQRSRGEGDVGALTGRPALVTGAGRGVGRGIALALAAAGAPVAVVDRAEDTLGDTCAEIERRGGEALPVVCDVRDLAAIERSVDVVVSAFGGLRILVNNAQISANGSVLEVSEQAVDDAWTSGPLAALRFMRCSHPHLGDGGAVVNISSGATMAAGANGLAAYAAAKAALQSFSRAAAVEWGGDGIRVNTVQPYVMSPGYEEFLRDHPEAVAHARALDHVPLKRMADAEADVGRAVVFLVGPDAGMITGTIVPVDGGAAYLR
jgi:meso-butanediol dehydrogenase / (S,S)-butanediol dehydrogenase / diacetyl reductase